MEVIKYRSKRGKGEVRLVMAMRESRVRDKVKEGRVLNKDKLLGGHIYFFYGMADI